MIKHGVSVTRSICDYALVLHHSVRSRLVTSKCELTVRAAADEAAGCVPARVAAATVRVRAFIDVCQ